MLPAEQSSAESHKSATDQSAPSEELRADQLLLERLKKEPPVKPQLPTSVIGVVILLVLALGTVVYFISQKPEKYAENPHGEGNAGPVADSSEILAKRLHFGPMVDSLDKVIKADPKNMDARLQYADVLYETESWTEAEKQYDIYLKVHPENANARVDFAFVTVQSSHDFKKGLKEIDKALETDPDHVKGLFNAGLFAVQAFEDKKEGLAASENYFKRAKAAAEKKGETEMISNIDRILEEIAKIKAAK